MNTSPIASRLAVDAARRGLTAPVSESRPRTPRRAIALALQSVAHRLDPHVTVSPRVTLGR
jgi:hypothetical protein